MREGGKEGGKKKRGKGEINRKGREEKDRKAKEKGRKIGRQEGGCYNGCPLYRMAAAPDVYIYGWFYDDWPL